MKTATKTLNPYYRITLPLSGARTSINQCQHCHQPPPQSWSSNNEDILFHLYINIYIYINISVIKCILIYRHINIYLSMSTVPWASSSTMIIKKCGYIITSLYQYIYINFRTLEEIYQPHPRILTIKMIIKRRKTKTFAVSCINADIAYKMYFAIWRRKTIVICICIYFLYLLKFVFVFQEDFACRWWHNIFDKQMCFVFVFAFCIC